MLIPPFRRATRWAVAHGRASIRPAAGGGYAHRPDDSALPARLCAWSPDAGCVTRVIDGRWWYHRDPVLRPDHIHIILRQAQRAGRRAPEAELGRRGRQK